MTVRRSLWLAAALSAALALPVATQAQTWSAVRIGDDSGIYTSVGMNQAGQVVGHYVRPSPSGGAYYGFFTNSNGDGMHFVRDDMNDHPVEAWRINSSGQIAGNGYGADFKEVAYVTGPNGAGMKRLSPFSGDDGTTAYGINDAGQVVGVSMPYETGLGTAFITDANGENMRALSTGQVGPYSVTGLSINSSGQVLLGSLDASHGLEQTFITGINGVGATLVGSLIEGGSTFGYGINDAGQITGRSAVADPEGFFGSAHAFLTDANGLNIHDLGTLGGNASMGYGVNASGQVVGESTIEGDGATHAFITGPQGAGMVDLNSLVTLADGAVLVGALAVNDLGQVLAYDQNSRSYLLSPFAVPEPGTYGLMLLGLCGVAVAVRRHKAPTA